MGMGISPDGDSLPIIGYGIRLYGVVFSLNFLGNAVLLGIRKSGAGGPVYELCGGLRIDQPRRSASLSFSPGMALWSERRNRVFG